MAKARDKKTAPNSIPAGPLVGQAPSANNIKHIVLTAFKKQWLFLLGTLFLIITWYIQTFTLATLREEISAIETYRNHVLDLTNLIQGYQFYVSQTEIHRKDFPDLSEYKETDIASLTNLAFNHCALQWQMDYLHYGPDTPFSPLENYYDCIKSINMLVKQDDSAGLKYLISRTAGKSAIGRGIEAENAGNERQQILEQTSKYCKVLSIVFVVLGTICISLNKAREFLLALAKKP